MAWTALTFAFASKLTSLKMTQLRNNVVAATNGETGATVTDANWVIANGTSMVIPAGLYLIFPEDTV